MSTDGSSSAALPEEALYLYCLTPQTPPAIDHGGLRDTGVASVRAGASLYAVVDRVPTKAWAGPAAQEHMASLDWVGPRAVLHEEVIEAVRDVVPVYPAHFGTLYAGPDRLRAAVAAHRDALDRFFARVAGTDEWAVKMLLDRDAAAAHRADASATDAATAASGTEYLQRRKDAQEARASVDAWVDDRAEALEADLRAQAETVRPQDPQQSVQASADAPVVRSWAVLAPHEAQAALQARVQAANDAHAEAGLHVRLTGPWPPYSFRPRIEDDAPAARSR
jgi:uncharacterized protein YdaU (DUF1376 family)